jgi:hypothetical protein
LMTMAYLAGRRLAGLPADYTAESEMVSA